MNKSLYIITLLFIVSLSTIASPITLSDNERWWGYTMDTLSLDQYGTGVATTYDVAVYIPSEYILKAGGEIRGVRFWFWSLGNISNVKVWASTKLPQTADSADMEVLKVSSSDIVGYSSHSMNEIAFMKPHAIPDEGLYVGYTFTIDSINYSGDSDNKYPVALAQGKHGIAGSAWIRTTADEGWVDISNEHCLAMQVLLSNRFISNGAGTVSVGSNIVTVKNNQATVPLTLTQKGTQPIQSIDCSIDEGKYGEASQHFDFPQPFNNFGLDTTINIPLYAHDATGIEPLTISIDKVNGLPNETGANYRSSNGSLLVTDKAVRRRSTIEEFTGTWCGYCTRGIAGMRLAKEHFGDSIIVICAHYNDTMAIDSYLPVIEASGASFPSCLINRNGLVDPYWGSRGNTSSGFALDQDIHYQQNQPVEAEITVSAKWDDDSNTILTATARPIFYYDNNEAPYGIAYVLKTDSLKGDGREWYQRNYLHGSEYAAKDSNLSEYANAPSTIRNMTYHDVAIDAKGIIDGIGESVKAPLVSGQEQNHQCSFDVGTNALAHDKNQLKVVALLFNRQTGLIINAAECSVADNESNGIDVVRTTTGKKNFVVYDLQGRLIANNRLPNNKRQIVIVRYSDGTVRKIAAR